MPTFKPLSKKSSSQNYGFLVDQLSILENQMESDGTLSPGDYKVLTEKARALYVNPGLTPDQRSNVAVKISAYESKSSVKVLQDQQDLDKLDREVKDTKKEMNALAIKDPILYLKANSDVNKSKIDKLTNTIDRLEASGGDATKYQDERDVAMQDYLDSLQALDDAENGNTASNYATYMVTNSYGEIVDMKIAKVGTVTGYIPTNGTYGGLTIYGKTNRKDDYGKNVFTLGNQNFVESQNIVSDAGGFGEQKQLILDGGATGGVSVNAGKVEIQSANLRAQNEIRRGGWAEGVTGILYQRGEDGNYTKYLNTDKEKLGLLDGDIYRMSTSTEQSVVPYSIKTIDGLSQTEIPSLEGPMMTPFQPEPDQPIKTPFQPGDQVTKKGTSNTGGAPTVRSPQTTQGVAGDMIGKVKGFFGSLFNK